mgnify:FL=1|tara:strand:+ start:363 stop:764 length:402 start_codon:yes stop_codon:yes gene_type:complete
MKYSFDFEEENSKVNILPMIDIIFVILSFFIVSSLYLVKLETIPVNLPTAETSNQEKDSLIVITLNLENRVFIDDKFIDISILENEIRSKLKFSNNKKIVLRADKDIKYGKVISILDILRKIENIKIGVSTES